MKTKDIHIKVTRARKEIQKAHSPIIPAQGLKNKKTTDPRDMKAAEGRGATMWGVGWDGIEPGQQQYQHTKAVI